MDADEPTSLEQVSDSIAEAHRAEDKLVEISPNAINPDETEPADAARADDRPVEPDGEAPAAEVPQGPRAPSNDPG